MWLHTCTVIEVPFPVDIEPSESNLKLEMCTEEESTLRLVTNMLHFMTQYTNGEKLAVSAMRNVTVAFVFIADITSQSDDQFQEKVVQEIAMVPGICRIILENICHSGKPMQLSFCGSSMKLKPKTKKHTKTLINQLMLYMLLSMHTLLYF